MSGDEEPFTLDDIPFNPVHDLRHRQTLFAVMAAGFAGLVVGLDLAISMASGAYLQPNWTPDARWFMWVGVAATVMALLGWISTDRARLKLNDDR